MQDTFDRAPDDAEPTIESSASHRKRRKHNDETDIESQPHPTPNSISNQAGLIKPCRLTSDIVAQAALHLEAPDILALARTNKSIRRLLMSRSSAHIWRTAMVNMVCLGHCPTAMSEPAYTALLFTSYCSKCGLDIPENIHSLDTSLLVRLCDECRASSLIERNDVQPKVIRTLVRLSYDAKYCLRSEVKKAARRLLALSASGGGAALKIWKRNKRHELKHLREDASGLAAYISGHEYRRRESMRPQPKRRPPTSQEIIRHAEIKRRLMAIGWTQEDMTFRHESQKPWMDILNMNTPVTERHWKKIRPRLMSLLKSNSTYHYLGRTGPGDLDQARARNTERLDRHHEITRRLKLLGWNYKDMEFPEGEEIAWVAIMNLNTPVTDKHWKNIRSRLEAMLQVNRQRRPAREKVKRQEARRVYLRTLWSAKKAEMETLNNNSSQSGSLVEAVSKVSHLMPIPELADALEWPVMRQLVESEILKKEVQARYDEQKFEIETATLNWCASIKSTLADLLRSGHSASGYSIGTRILGVMAQEVEPNLFEPLSTEMQLLLRADSVFCSPGGYRSALYEQYLVSMRDFTGHSFEKEKDALKPLNTSKLEFNPASSSIARAILRSLGRPENMSFLELRLRNESFICGRCGDDQPKSWEEIIGYYIKRQQEWSSVELSLPWFARKGIACHHIHDINANSDKPLAKVLTPEERIILEARRDDKKGDWLLLECCLCSLGRAPCSDMIRPHMLDHLRDV
ncbi:hypothetical protein BDV93DRAFT_82107 [Ceratobasidium sp. AG-I]|nr:hypothetical protein BDV93DRAFT_82107 [Ceratobasidium sp. AG-I]